MSVSLERYLVKSEIREIDRDYHIKVIAKNVGEMKEYHASTLRLQAEAAIENLRAIGDLAQRQNQTNVYLTGIARDMSEILCDIDQMNVGIDRLVQGMYDLNVTLDCISQQMMEQKRVLEDIAELLRCPYEAKTLELRREADKWLVSGMNNTGRDRDEDWKDAKRLLQSIVENPIGNQDYVVWFQIGWLLWKHEQKADEAEEAFYRAQRLSAHKRDLYHVNSLRHLAYMQYLQNNHGKAYETIQKALTISQDHDIMYDAARYAAKTGRDKESLDLLDRCIDLQPTTIITMFSEVDLQ